MIEEYIKSRIAEAKKNGKTEICFTKWMMPPQEVISKYEKMGYNWYVMKSIFLAYPIYYLSWDKRQERKSFLSKIVAFFSKSITAKN